MEDILSRLSDYGIVSVLCPPTAEDAEPLANALTEGGIPTLEVTLRKPCALDVIRRIHASFPELLLGAGTVFTTEQVDAAVAAGAKFIVSPGFDPDLCRYCIERGIPVTPGCITPSEMTQAVKLGLRNLKFFPAEQSGGLAALTLFHGPFPDCSFIPTGGLNFSNVGDYLSKPFIAACGGSFAAPSGDVAAKNWSKITDACRKVMDIVLDFKLERLAIHHSSRDEAVRTAEAFGKLFRFPVSNAGDVVQTGSALEQNVSAKYGEKGHVVFSTRSVKRALAWYRRNGISLREESIQMKGKDVQSFYLADEFAGYAVQIVGR